MSASPTLNDIVCALKESGYLMEQEVATQLERLDFHVSTNWAFEDSNEGKSREIDVRAIKRVAHNKEKKLSAFVEIIAECKNSANPFVFIGRPKNQTDNLKAPQELVFSLARYYARDNHSLIREKDAFFHLGFDKVHPEFATETKAVQFCRIDRKAPNAKKWHANHGGIYDAIFYPMAKAITFRKNELLENVRNEGRYFWLFVPIVILSGDIFSVDSTETDPVPQKRDYVTFKREIQSEKLSGLFSVDFIRQKRLEEFISARLGPLITKMTDLTMNNADFVLKRDPL